jgi:hypothetical protein
MPMTVQSDGETGFGLFPFSVSRPFHSLGRRSTPSATPPVSIDFHSGISGGTQTDGFWLIPVPQKKRNQMQLSLGVAQISQSTPPFSDKPSSLA